MKQPKLDIGLTGQQRRGVSEILNVILADEYLLYTKTRNYHWNVTGAHFHDLHKFFEAQYGQLDGMIDDVAERIRSLGDASPGSLSEFSQLARLKEQTGAVPDAQEMLHRLLKDHESLIKYMRIDLELCADPHHDLGTQDFLTGLMETHEKMAWMLRASLDGK